LFIVLGRIFDNNPDSHTFQRLLDTANSNRQIFSRPALANRKRLGGLDAPSAIVYAADAHVPSDADIRRMHLFAQRKRRVYKKAYAKIRHKIFAHSGIISAPQSAALFAKTRIRELQGLVLSLREFHEALWQLYVNGHKPTMRRQISSVVALRKRAARKDRHVPLLHEKVVHEAFELLMSIKN
jgi:hypothetical protein